MNPLFLIRLYQWMAAQEAARQQAARQKMWEHYGISGKPIPPQSPGPHYNVDSGIVRG